VLETYIRNRLKEKNILLMTHIVLGYPTFDDCFKIVQTMVDAGVDLMELQIPFSEPIADGPVILHANQKSLASGTRVAQCLEFAEAVAAKFEIPFLLMSYYNILFQYGVDQFALRMAQIGLKGAIVPDLPPEEGAAYQDAMESRSLAPIYIFSPTTPDARMKLIDGYAKGFIYCVARKGVTGENTQFSNDVDGYLQRCRENTKLPLAVGFGVKDRADVDFLQGKADIAVIGSETIRIIDEFSIDAAGEFIRKLIGFEKHSSLSGPGCQRI
jgi:tryptophan synthase alpha chain